MLRRYESAVEASRNVLCGEAMIRGEMARRSFDVPLEGRLPPLELTLPPIAR
jgi:hypothetical protein